MSTDTDVAIRVSNVFKSFKLPHEKQSSVKGLFLNAFNGKRTYEKQEVLKGINLEIKKGEFVGIVGRNGSGKSTLLKLMAGIYSPDAGSVEVEGQLTPFIELGVGFSPDLTGRENVFLNGALLGFNRDEMNKMYDGIVEFAELSNFMDQKLKNYSSGMQVRLAFSIAIRARSDILVLDEVLAVGDSAFQQKCYDYFGSLKQKNVTVVLVTHDMSAVEKFCEKAILIESGKVVKTGNSLEVADAYRALFNDQIEAQNQLVNDRKQQDKDDSESIINLNSIKLSQNDRTTTLIKALKPFSVELSFDSSEEIESAVIGLNIVNSQNLILVVTSIGAKGDNYRIKKGKNTVKINIEENIYNDDSYYINLAIANKENANEKLIYKQQQIHKFSIKGINKHKHSITHPKYSVEIE